MITGYFVQYRRNGSYSYTTRSVSGSNTTSYTITNLNRSTVYEVRVASVGPLGLSGYCCGSGKQVVTGSEYKHNVIRNILWHCYGLITIIIIPFEHNYVLMCIISFHIVYL